MQLACFLRAQHADPDQVQRADETVGDAEPAAGGDGVAEPADAMNILLGRRRPSNLACYG
ncbi:hypothetical protein [Pseudonocardia sp. T1-2H]|uniref:hypothetical protein n=1 Tax=Pseudonocardia sp. T1-2H TaxID=3128899 RepID=UPI0031010198